MKIFSISKVKIIAAVFLFFMMIVSGCTDQMDQVTNDSLEDEEEQQNQAKDEQQTPAPDGSEDDQNQSPQEDHTALPVFEIHTCQDPLFADQESDTKSLDVTFALPQQNQQVLKGIRQISVRKLFDEAGYGFGFGSSFALDNEGRVYAWGQRYGAWDHEGFANPVRVEGLPEIIQVAGEYALTPTGKVWFMNGIETPFEISELSDVQSISTLETDVLAAVTGDGQLWTWRPAWNDPTKGTLGKIDQAQQVKAVYGDIFGMYWIDAEEIVWYSGLYGESRGAKKIPLPEGEKVKQVDTTYYSEDYLITTGGNVYKINRDLTLESIPIEQVEKISSTEHERYFLKRDGTVWSEFTYNNPGDSPVQISGLHDITDIQSGSNHTLALASDGTVYSWGSNMYGQLGRQPHFFETFTPIGKLTGIQDVLVYHDGIRFIHKGNVWRINDHMEVEPVLLERRIVKLTRDGYLSEDGTLFIRSDIDGDVEQSECYQVQSNDDPIRDVLPYHGGWILKLDSGKLYKIELRNDSIAAVQTVIFPENQQPPRIKQLFDYPFFTVLTEEGEVYYQRSETEEGITMEKIPDLPSIREWSTLKYTYYDFEGNVVRALDDEGNAYGVEMTVEPVGGKDFKRNFNLVLLQQGVKHIYGGLFELSDDTILETGLAPYDRTSLEERNWPNLLEGAEPLDVQSIYTQYNYPIEGPSSFRHVLIGKDGTVMIYGYSPFSGYEAEPAPVVIDE